MHICRNNQCPARGRKCFLLIITRRRTRKQSMPRQGTEILTGYKILVPNHHETINAPPGDGNFNSAVGVLQTLETINAPPGDGNHYTVKDLSDLLRKQSMPRQGTEMPFQIFQKPPRAEKQSMPRQGTEIFDFPFISYDSNETINAPSGDGNIPVLRIKLRAVLKQSMPRQGTEIAKASRLDTAP